MKQQFLLTPTKADVFCHVAHLLFKVRRSCVKPAVVWLLAPEKKFLFFQRRLIKLKE